MAALTLGLAAGGPPAVAAPAVRVHLLTAGQLSKGWSVVAVSGSAHVKCLTSILPTTGGLTANLAQVVFESTGLLPVLAERLERSINAPGIYTTSLAQLLGCRRMTGTIDSQVVVGTLKRIATHRYGAASSAFAATGTVGGSPGILDIELIRLGEYVLWVEEANTVAPNPRQFQSLVAKAYARIQ